MIASALDPEAALLVACARVRADEREAGQIRQRAAAGPDWNRVLDLAQGHGMRPLLSHHLNTVCPDAVPREVTGQLRAFVRLNAARNLALTRELLALLSLLGAQDIQAVPYKGPVLAEATYGSLALREFRDLDILVRPQDAVRARALMIARGYRPEYVLGARHDAAFRREYCEYLFRHTASGAVVEIQWDIAPRFFSLTLDRAGLEQRLATATVLGTTVPSLGAEDLLFILCVHGGKHAWSKLEWLCGVAEVIRGHPGLDWNLVIALAGRAGASRLLRVGLALARDVLDVKLPPAVVRVVNADRAASQLAGELAGRMFGDDQAPARPLPGALLQVRMRERWSDRLRYAIRLSSTPSARDWSVLSSSSAPRMAAYPVRLIRLAWKHALGYTRGY